MAEFYSPQEVADRLGVSVYTIRRYIRAGKLRAVKLEGAYRVGRDDLSAFLRDRRIGDVPADAASPDGATGAADHRS
jgi:excisionase family DNA binding protein